MVISLKNIHLSPTPRNAALTALMHVGENEGYSNIVLDKTLKQFDFDKRDKALVSQLFYGVLENKLSLDYYIRCFLKRPDAELNAVVQEILRIAVYQCIYLDKIPENAIVDEAVKAVKELKRDGLTGFVNGLLRELLREKDSISLPQGDSLQALSLRFSVPEPLISMWVQAYSKPVTEKLLASFEEKSKTYVRLNTLRAEDLPGAKAYSALPGAYCFSEGGNPAETEAFAQGLYHVQDLSSQYLCAILNPQKDELVMDVCAAPGGKSFTISQLMEGTGKVYAYDLYKGRVGLIRSGAYRLGLNNILASIRDGRSEKCEISDADRILCDVPCSGFGTIRRKPEIRYKDLKALKDLPELQYDILEKSSRHLRKGGTLVYSTCTLNPAENGDIAKRFLMEHPEFSPKAITVPKGLSRSIEEPENQLTMMPFAGDTDGFFVAVFSRD